MKRQFMLDIETTGVDPLKDEVLQIALVEMNFTKSGYWEPGRKFNFFQHTDRDPETEFAKVEMQEIFARAQREPFTPIPEVREQLLDFVRGCGAKPPNVYFSGWNIGIFDLPFLSHHGYLKPARYEQGKLVGDCHYRLYEISGSLQFVANLLGRNEINPLINEALEHFPPPEDGKRHDAAYDCDRQISILNGLLKICRESGLQ